LRRVRLASSGESISQSRCRPHSLSGLRMPVREGTRDSGEAESRKANAGKSVKQTEAKGTVMTLQRLELVRERFIFSPVKFAKDCQT
jgi:hypothetical protein